jgi:prepilin-type N-terminal cleavage/methylation domain-containing protein
MNAPHIAGFPIPAGRVCRRGFTLVELLLVMVIIAILSAILLPALSKARARAEAIACLNNTRQLIVAWQLYANDHDSLLPYNLGMNATSFRTNLNWVNNVMTWDTAQDNTNLATITDASLGPYISRAASLYHCPSDRALSGVQSAAGWDHRIRSYSMNAMVGNAGAFSANGYNVNNPGYKQFFKSTQIPQPVEIFVFLDEHPDSIDDGYFLNKHATTKGSYGAAPEEWHDLPASYHIRATAFSYADGHASLHRWVNDTTLQPLVPNGAPLPIQIPATPANADADFDWMMEHMSTEN